MFTVRSCYRRSIGEQQWPHAGFWRKLWSLDLPSKVNNFIWRACKTVVPTTVVLAEKRVEIDTRCSWCLVLNEDITHVLFGCSFAKVVWSKVGIQEVSTESCQGSIWEAFSHLFNICT